MKKLLLAAMLLALCSVLSAQPVIYCAGSAGGRWQCAGPFTNAYGGYENQGRVNSVWVSPNDTNHIIAGTFGGVWESTNGGNSWHNISDNIGTGYGSILIPGTMAISCLAVDPLDSNQINVILADWGGTMMGAAYTTDGGSTWQSDTGYNHLAGVTVFGGYQVQKMMYMPFSEALFSYYGSKLMMKPHPSSPWADITPPLGADNKITDMEFTIASGGYVVISTNAADYTGHLWTYYALGATWTNLNITMPSSSDTITNIDDISLSATDSVFMLVNVTNVTGSQQLVSTPLSSLNMTVLNTYTGVPGTYQYLLVSPNNTNIFYTSLHNGGSNFYQSTDRGASFSPIQGSTHADGRYFTIYGPGAGGGGPYDDVLYGCTDGGVVKKRYGQTNFQSITGDSLCITQFFSVSNPEGDEDDIMIGGAQDNGGLTYNKNRAIPWASTVASDNQFTKFMRNGLRAAYTEQWSPHFLDQVNFGPATETVTAFTGPTEVQENDYRPWYIDNNNTAYVGDNQVWKRPLSTSTWTPAYSVFPFPDTTPINIGDIAISDADSNTVYIAYYAGTSSGVTLTGLFNPYGRLFLSQNAYDPTFPIEWASITPDSASTYPIQCIEIDPLNAGHIWAGFGGVDIPDLSTSVEHARTRVYYSPDYGATWYDVSAGLPPLAVIAIKYRPGSNDELYCGTSLGMYKCDFSTFNPSDPPYYNVTWNCYNDGMPLCQVTGIDINACGKMRVSTMGRGIWETELDSIQVQPTKVITASQTWSGSNQYIDGSIDVKPGATLTIGSADTVHMPKNGAIMVEPGAHLIVSGATITNGCSQCFWQGLQAWGNSSAPQSAATQGWITIKNGSVIENAVIATSNYNPADSTDNAGGVIQVTQSTLLDNQSDASFVKYQNFTPGPVTTPLPDLSYFDNSTFLLDNNYKGYTPYYDVYYTQPEYRVYMSGSRGISFLGDQFLNRNTTLTVYGVREGIHAVDANFNLADGPPTSPTAPSWGYFYTSRFSGFTTGISIAGTGADLSPMVSIYQATFDTTHVGVHISAFNNVSTTFCTFNEGEDAAWYPYTCAGDIGINIENSPQFRIEDNFFRGWLLGAEWYDWGVRIANTASGSPLFTTIKTNTFDSLTIGVYSVGSNRYTVPPINSGLHILCNAFEHNVQDMVVTSDGGAAAQGICVTQGMLLTSSVAPAENIFNNAAYTTGNIINSVGSDEIGYYYRSGITSQYPPIVSAVPFVSRAAVPGHEDSCAIGYLLDTSSIGTGSTDMPVLRSYEATFYGSNAIMQDSLAEYNALIDFGNTAGLVATIAASTDTTTLYTLLGGGAPYLSETALEAVARYMALPYYSMMNILKQNPDNLSDSAFLGYMQHAYSLSTADMDTLIAASYDSTARTGLVWSMAAAQAVRDDNANLIMMALKSAVDTNVSTTGTRWGAGLCLDSTSIYYLLDSNSSYLLFDSVDAWLQNIGAIWTYYDRVAYYNGIGQYNTANTIFTSINAILPPVSPDRDVYTTYSRLWDVVYNAETNGRSIYQLDSADIAALDTTSATTTTYNTAEMDIMNITTSVINSLAYTASPCAYFGGSSSSRTTPHGGAITPPIININAASQNQQFSAYPNPTSGVVTFSYNVPDGTDGITILVTNIVGEQVVQIQTANNTGSSYWDPRNLASGVYIYQASDAKGMISKGKIVVER